MDNQIEIKEEKWIAEFHRRFVHKIHPFLKHSIPKSEMIDFISNTLLLQRQELEVKLNERLPRERTATKYKSVAKATLQVPDLDLLEKTGEYKMINTIEEGKEYEHEEILSEEDLVWNSCLQECKEIINRIFNKK